MAEAEMRYVNHGPAIEIRHGDLDLWPSGHTAWALQKEGWVRISTVLSRVDGILKELRNRRG